MKSKTAFSLLATAAIALPASSEAQVKIPAKSGSTLDDPAETSNLAVIQKTSRSQFSGQSNVSRNAPAGPKQPKPQSLSLPTPGAVTAVQRVEDPKLNINPKRSLRLSELRRELGVAETARQARIALPTEDLFEKTAPTEIDDLSEATLKKVAEYLNLSGFETVTVKPFYLRDKPCDKELSWTRSLSLIEWMDSHTKLNTEAFKANGPDPVSKATPKKVAKNLGETEFVGRIELHLE